MVDDPDEARKLLGASYETGDDSGFEPSEDIARLASELRSSWPDDYQSDPPQDCPSADMPLTQSERLLAIDIRWSAGDAAVAAIYEPIREPSAERGTGTFCSEDSAK